MACVHLPALPLQLVWQHAPAWRAQPVVVIDQDRPQGIVQWACERALSAGILPGHRYAHALARCRSLRARVVPSDRIEEALRALRTRLHRLSPRVHPGQPGTFWLDGEGLERLFGDGQPDRAGRAWGTAIAGAITELGYAGAIVVGFSRFATYAIARAARSGVTVSHSDAEERRIARAVPLARLDIEPRLRDALARLGVTSVGQMVQLPGGGILERFGHQAHELYQLARGEKWDPVVAVAPPEAFTERIELDDDEHDIERLVFAIKAPLDRLLERLAARGRALTMLHLELALRHAVGQIEARADCIQPATATLDGRALLHLVHLRLAAMPPNAPVHAIKLWAEEVAARRDQLALFAARPRRDLRAADEAIARVRSELGDDAVVRAVLREGHLPEASFGWERLTHVVPARPGASPPLVPLVRRLRAHPQALPPQARQVRDDGWLLSGLAQGAVVRILGPYVISGGWWNPRGASEPVHREYHFAELRRGDCLWIYYDRPRRRWFCHGAIE